MEEKRVVSVNNYEYNLLLNALNEYRNMLIQQDKSTAVINEIILRLIDAPLRKRTIFKRENAYER